MGWKFWNTAQKPSAFEWPKDLYHSARFVFGMYVTKAPPFNDWEAPGVALTPAARETAELAVTISMLNYWLGTVAQEHGLVACEMAKDVILGLAAQLDSSEDGAPPLDVMLRQAFQLCSEGLTAGAEQNRQHPGGQYESYTVALTFLLRIDGSPYYMTENLEFNGDDIALARCVEHGIRNAHVAFEPMHQAVLPFDSNSFGTWIWRETPGANEHHLQRRHNNPLFAAARQNVTGGEVYRARVADDAAWAAVQSRAAAVQQEWQAGHSPADPFGFLSEMRERIHEVIADAEKLGPAGASLERALLSTRETIVGTWEQMNANNPDGLELLRTANAAYDLQRMRLRSQWRRQLGQAIRADEVVPSIFFEDEQTIELLVKEMEDEPTLRETLLQLRTGALDVARPVLLQDPSREDLRRKLAIVGVLP